MSGNRTITTRLRAEMDQFKREWNAAGKAVEDTEKKIVRSSTALGNLASDVDNNGRAWDVAGKTILASGLVMAAGIGFSVKAAIEWEAAWAGVLKTVDGTPAQLAELEKGLRTLATQLPASATEIAGVAEAAGALGVARKDILSFTRTMIDLGETTNLTADEAATSIAQIANVMKTAPDDVDNFGSALVALGNDGASTEKQILEMAQRIAGAGAIIGLTESDVLGISNALASVGIEAEAGGSAVSRILIDISKAVSTNSSDLAKWAQVSGMSVEEFSAKWKTSPAEGFEAFTSGLGKVNAAGGDVFTMLDELGQSDIRTTQALLSMATSGDVLSDSLKGGAEAWRQNTALAEEAEKRYGTTAAQIEIAKNKVNESMISIGEGMLPAVQGVLGGLGEILDMFNYLPGPIKSSVGVVGGFGAAFTTAGGLAVLAIPKILAFTDAVGAMKSGPLKTTGSALMGFGRLLMGPVGIGLAAATLALGIWAKRNADAQQAQAQLNAQAEAFSATLDKQTGAVTAATRQQVADNLARDGSLAFADKYKISQALVVEAALGSKDAIAELGQEIMNKDVDIWKDKDVIGKIFTAGKAAQKGKQEFKASADVLSELQQEQIKAGDTSRGLAMVLNGLSPDAEEAQKKLDALRESTTQVSMSFLDFSKNLDPKEMGFGEYVRSLEEMAQAQEDWADNLIVATARGVKEGVIDNFKAMGPEGAKRLAELADATDKEIDRVNSALGSVEDSTSAASAVLDDLPREILTEFKTPGARGAINTAVKLADQYDMTPKQIETILEALDYSSGDIKRVKERLRELDRAKAEPKIDARGNALRVLEQVRAQMMHMALMAPVNMIVNTIRRERTEKAGGGAAIRHFAAAGAVLGPGTGTSDDIPAMLSNGEHVLTAAEVAMAGGQSEIYRLRAAIRSGDLPKFAAGGAATRLEIKQQQRTVRDIERSLREREEYGKKPKKGRRKTRKVLRGLDAQIARLELAEARQELRDLQTGAAAKESAAEQTQQNVTSAKSDFASNFSISGLSSTSSVSRRLDTLIADASLFTTLLSDLKKKGASPWLLAQLVNEGPTKGAIRLAKQYSTDSAALAAINGKATQIDQLTSQYGGMVGNPKFSSSAAWNPGISNSSTSTVNINAVDPAAFFGEIRRVVRHELSTTAQGANV